ncbi:MAG: HNH endonuclease signature motif containing protein [Ilumatobacteraceae bacterium]
MNTELLDEVTGRVDRPIDQVADELIDATEAELDERIRSLELLRRRVDAELAVTVAAAERRRVFLADGHRTMKGYLRATCNWSNADIAGERRLAKATDHVPGLAEALHSGRVGTAQAAAIARVDRNPRVRDRLVEFAPTLLELAEHLCHDDFVLALQRFELLADTDGAHRDRDEQHDRRNVHVTTVGGALHLDAAGGDALVNDELEAIFNRFCEHEFRHDTAARRAEHGDDAAGKPLARTHRQRSYDAFVNLMRRANAHLDTVDGAPDASGTVVDVVTDARTFGLILADAGLAPTENLTGAPIDPFTGLPAGAERDLLRDLLADLDAFASMRCETSRGTLLHPHDVLRATLAGHVRRVVVDARSVPIDMGRKQRLFTGAAREAAKLLARRCDHAGCDLPDDFCDVDHVTEWNDGGPTDQDNAGIECQHHNHLKHRRRTTTRRGVHGQRYTIRPDGSIILPVGARPPTFPTEADDGDDPSATAAREAIETAESTRIARARLRRLRRAA